MNLRQPRPLMNDRFSLETRCGNGDLDPGHMTQQLLLPLTASLTADRTPARNLQTSTGRDALRALLAGDLDFKGQDSGYASHNFHAFAAKFPPQLPRAFIEALTEPGELVLDPMMGSGTTLLEAYLADRRAIGCDLDPLAILQT